MLAHVREQQAQWQTLQIFSLLVETSSKPMKYEQD